MKESEEKIPSPSRIEGPQVVDRVFPEVALADAPQRHYEDKYFVSATSGSPKTKSVASLERSKSKQPTLNRVKRQWLVGVAIFLILAVAIATPISVVMSRHKRSTSLTTDDNLSSTPQKDSLIKPTAVTNKTSIGALNGTRLATMDPRTGGGIWLFYQLADGKLQYISQSPTRIWQGIIDMKITDAKLGTPLCATYLHTNASVFVSFCNHQVVFRADSIQYWLFYVDQFDVIQNIFSQDDSTTWRKGNIGSQGYKIPDNSSVAFAVSRGRQYNSTLKDSDAGLRLLASNEQGIVGEYVYDDEVGTWSDGYTFPNTTGLSGATTWSKSRDTYLFTAKTDDAMQLWWRRYDDTTMTHQADSSTWTLGPASTMPLVKGGSVCSQFDLAFQGPDGKIQGSTFTDLDTPINNRWGVTYDISNGSATDKSGLSCWYFFPGKMNTRFHVFYQIGGNEIIEARSYWDSGKNMSTVPGNWTYQIVPLGS
ncbi:MAG: hypothetical protein Q9222_001520 [Ikaeria aurantiellina]